MTGEFVGFLVGGTVGGFVGLDLSDLLSTAFSDLL